LFYNHGLGVIVIEESWCRWEDSLQWNRQKPQKYEIPLRCAWISFMVPWFWVDRRNHRDEV